MSDESISQHLEGILGSALGEAELLKNRIESGEAIDEAELETIARHIAIQMEKARTILESAVGPVDHELLKANLKAKLPPEEYQEWLRAEELRIQMRKEEDPEVNDETKVRGLN